MGLRNRDKEKSKLGVLNTYNIIRHPPNVGEHKSIQDLSLYPQDAHSVVRQISEDIYLIMQSNKYLNIVDSATIWNIYSTSSHEGIHGQAHKIEGQKGL